MQACETDAVWNKGYAGLGNRLLSLLSCHLYAEVTGRQLWVDWTDPQYSEDGSNAFPRLFQASDTIYCQQRPEGVRIYPQVWEGQLETSVARMTKDLSPRSLGRYSSTGLSSIDLGCAEYPGDLLVAWSFDDQIHRMRRLLARRNHPYSSLPRFEILTSLAKRLLIPSEEVSERIRSVVNHGWEPGRMVGVHIRYTDRKVPLQVFYQTIAEVFARSPDVKLFLATDSADVQREICSRYPRALVASSILSTTGKLLHGGARKGRCEHAVEALTDMMLLGQCDQLIYASRSTFSFISHLIAAARGVVCVTDIDASNLKIKAKRWVQRNVPKSALGLLGF